MTFISTPSRYSMAAILVTTSLMSGCDIDAPFNIKVPVAFAGEEEHSIWLLQKTHAATFVSQATGLSSAVEKACSAGSLDTTEVKSAWVDTMKAWMPLQGIETSNPAAASLNWQIQFYPDKKNTTGRKITALLKSEGPYSAEALAKQSVSVQGVGALEWLIYEPKTTGDTENRCALARAVSQRLIQSAEGLSHAWEQDPWKDQSEKALNAASVSMLAGQLDFVMKKLSLPMGKPGYPKPFQAEAWRSKVSLTLIKDNVAAMYALYLTDLDVVLRAKQKTELADRLTKHWQDTVTSVPSGDALKPLLDTPENYRSLIGLSNNLEYLKLALSDEVGPALGMVVGFNSTDGD
ncbi:hypothetical protein A1OS_11220 [Enterovibrio norvegicus]|uniref:imelysin family protein n=1 Tax=Enterovibrio norvegicus TaxID=188144 RepID=UPI0003827B31|nr:imelysin family protein [Enterovibrio norvegicus]OEE43305.1 hypothetical protein A1OS_11220 [Enterovibrio norvegicus]